MIKNSQYISLQEVLSRVTRNPLLQSVTMEQAVLYTVDFIHIFGLPEMYEDKEVTVSIKEYRGLLPCDLISINQVMETCSGICLRSMTDTFFPDDHTRSEYYSHAIRYDQLPTFKVKNHIIFTSFKKGEIKVNYKAIPVDENGFPMILDNSKYQKALELYIKKEIFTMKFEKGELSDKVLAHTELLYAWSAGQLASEMSIPSESEMESICNMFTELILTNTHFLNGFKDLGSREYLRKH